jgi:Protein of unknown function (DUF4199)
MKKIVLTYGLIGGAILSATMLATLPFQERIGFGKMAMTIGYTSMVIAFLLIFFGVRSYRDNVAGGSVGFGRAFAVGLLIATVGSACYVVTWEIIYFKLAPGYTAKYQAHLIEEARASGASEEALAKQKVDLAKFAALYDNPLINAAMTFAEPFPVGLVVTLVTAGVLSRKRRDAESTALPPLSARTAVPPRT